MDGEARILIMKGIIICILVLLGCWLPMKGYCQHDNVIINRLTIKEGLSNNHVTQVLQDKKGFIWIATYEGLNRWNGYEFEVFMRNPENPNSLPGNFILSLAEDSVSNIWIGTNNDGLVRYNNSEEKFYRYSTIAGDEHSIQGNIIRCITVDERNNVWIGTNYGLARYDAAHDKFSRYQFPNDMGFEPFADVRRIIQVSKEYLLIQNNLGLFYLNITNDLIQKVGYNIPEYNNKLFTQNEPVLLDNNSNLWVGSQEGLLKYNIKTGSFKKYVNDEADDHSISSNSFSVIFEDSQGNIWIGTRNRGVNLYDKENDSFIVFQEDNKESSLSNNIITDIYEDNNANIWFSTQEGGANYINYKSRRFEYYTHNHLNENSLSSNKVGVIQEDQNGNIWIGTKNGGLNKFIQENKSFKRFHINTAFLFPSILAIEDHSPNSLFISGWEMGLHEFHPATGTTIDLMKDVKIEGKKLSVNIKGITKDSKGNLWIASHEKNGILVYNPASGQFYNAAKPGPFDPSLLSIEYAVSIVEDSKERLWVVSYAGVYMFDTVLHAFKHQPANPSSVSSNYTYDLLEDAQGDIWVGNASGLDKIIEKDGEFSVKRYNDQPQLPINIKGILEDDHGNLWLSSNKEITMFNPESGKVRQYTVANEIPNQEFYERARLKSASGEMFFGGINGFLKFHPDSLLKGEFSPEVYIVDFQIFNKSQKVNEGGSPLKKTISETKEIELAYDQSVLTFEFAALDFNPYQQLEYAYKMEGFDEQWYFVGEKRFATYTNLPPGDYTFHVKLVEGNSLKEGGSSIILKINPPFWLTGWAYVLYGILIVLIFYLFRKAILYREQLRNELKLEKLETKNIMETNLMKLRFFTNVSHEFRTPLTLIKAPIEKLIQTAGELTREQQVYHYSLIESNTNKLLDMVNQLMDYRKLEAGSLVLEPSTGDIVEFCRKMWAVFEPLAKKSNIVYDFKSGIDSHIMSFDTDKLDKIVSNLLSNAFKNTNEYGHITLHIERIDADETAHGGNICISVTDDGVGISDNDLPKIFDRFYSVSRKDADEPKGTGIGLALAKELAELHKGTLAVESKMGKGSIFKLIIPFGKGISNGDQVLEVPKEMIYKKAERQIEDKILGDEKPKRQKILLVEDDNELKIFLQNELAGSFDVFLAKDGKEGLAMALFEMPDIIISDVTMPRMDGFELCNAIRCNERTSHIPLILLTARHSQEKHLEGLESGADDYILKPFNVEILKSRILNLLASRQELINKFKEGTGLVFGDDSVDSRESDLVQLIIDIVLENIEKEKINADFIAQRINMSRSLVYLKIEALTGQSVNEFVRTVRLKKSLQLLKANSMNVTQVAYAVGFSSQSYYTRSFIKQFGVSPKDYMSKHKII